MGKKHRRRTLSRKQLRFRRQSRPGANPAIVQAPIEAKPSRMHVLAYSPKQFLDKDITDLAALSGMAASHSVCWIDVAGLADVGLVKQLGEKFDLHPLAIEDVMNGGFGEAASTSVHTMTGLVFVSPDEAWFTYDVETTSGSFTNRFGIAYRIDGVWKITRAVICQDLSLAGGQCLPPVPQIQPPG